MRGKFILALVTALWLSGCAAHIDDKFLDSEDFKASGKGVAVLDATPLGRACIGVKVFLGEHRTAEADWRITKIFTVQSLGSSDTGDGDQASEVALAPGEYEIMRVSCVLGGRTINMVAKLENVSKPSIFGFRSTVLRVAPTPLAIFSVAAGEVVDIGSISAHQTGPRSFVPEFGPMRADVRAGFQAAKPKLASIMVTRPMIPTGSHVPPLAIPSAAPAQ